MPSHHPEIEIIGKSGSHLHLYVTFFIIYFFNNPSFEFISKQAQPYAFIYIVDDISIV